MSDAFNPYEAWLGIPTAEQPPDCYRLLGLPPFECEPRLIRHRVEEQIARVRALASPGREAVAQWLIDQIAAAHACLIAPAAKAAYDEQLRLRLAELAASAPGEPFAASAASDTAADTKAPHAAPDASTRAVSEAARRAGRRTSPAGFRIWKYALVALTAALLPACIAIIELNVSTDAPAKDGARRTASAAGAARRDSRQDDERHEDGAQCDEARQDDAPRSSDSERSSADAGPPEPVEDVAIIEATDDAADQLSEGPETSLQTPDAAVARPAVPPVNVDAGPEVAGGNGASDVAEHRSAPESSSASKPELAFADDPKDDDGADAPAGEPAVAAKAPANDWLKLDEHGEPCEVRLADGTTLKLETYGGSFQGFDAQPPLLGEQADRIFTKIVSSFDPGWGSVALDLKHKTVYFGEGSESRSRLMRASLRGNPRPLMEYSEFKPDYPTPDPEHGKLYWYTHGLRNGRGRSIYCGNLDASNPKEIITGLRDFRGFAIDSTAEKLYYFDSGHLIRTELDGSDEHSLLEATGGPLAIDHDGGKIYWRKGPTHIRRVNLDGTGGEDIVDVLNGNIATVALDSVGKKVYWVSHRNIRRADLDGSNIRDVIVGLVGNTGRLAFDGKKSQMYWMPINVVHGKKEIGLWRADLGKPAQSKSKPAPALVTGFVPRLQKAGEQLSIAGANFDGTSQVLFIDDGSGQATKAKFEVGSDSALSVVVPKLSDRCRHPVIIIQNKGGITATLPHSARVVKHEAVDRFHADDQFAYVVPPDGAISIDRGVVLASGRSTATARQYGKNTFLLKNGSVSDLRGAPDNLIYSEPSATLSHLDKLTKGSKIVRVPAIRPSFLETLFEYQQPE